jgi:hypothetical protein
MRYILRAGLWSLAAVNCSGGVFMTIRTSKVAGMTSTIMKKRMARDVLVEVVEKRGRADLDLIERKLKCERVLGFGVEPIDVVHEAERQKKVKFDPQRQEVILLRK